LSGTSELKSKILSIYIQVSENLSYRLRIPKLLIAAVGPTIPKTYTQPWVTPKSTVSLVPGAELWEYFCVPSDHLLFNDSVFAPVAGREKK
jgi:hypothetical protein